jgi:hypothetical protein
MPLLTRTWTRAVCSLRSAAILFSISHATLAFFSATRWASLLKVERREFDFVTPFSDEPFSACAAGWFDSTSGSADFVASDSVAIVLWEGVCC